MILMLAVVFLALAAFLAGEVATEPTRRQRLAVRRAAGYGRVRQSGTVAERVRFRERVVGPAIARLASFTLRLNPKTTVETIGTRLLAAGLSSRVTATQFLALKGGLGLGGAFLGLVFAVTLAPIAVMVAPILGIIGFLLPDLGLGYAIRGRRDRICAELPDALDLLAVSVEAGLGFDGAITKLTERMSGALVHEFAITLGAIRIGEARHEALKKMADRVPAPEVAAFVRSVVQADQLGISLGRILRVQAADSRLRRQAAAEERAMKAPIKMLFPTVLFIFPAMFLVILGPAFMNLAHYLK